jgi:hypothetical protein
VPSGELKPRCLDEEEELFQVSRQRSQSRIDRSAKKAEIDHFIDKDGIVSYSADEEEIVENDLIGSIRNRIFPSWQVLTCPSDWTGSYKDYMNRHGIPFREELSNGELWFLIPRQYRPHAWKLDGPTKRASRTGT